MSNKKLIAIIAVIIVAVPVGWYSYYVYGPHDFTDVYDDCYLELQDATSVTLRSTESHNSKSLRPQTLGTNYEGSYGSGGNTLFKRTAGSQEYEEVKMYELPEGADITNGGAVEDRQYRYIDRDVKSVTGLDDRGIPGWTLIEFYGLESNTDSYQCYMNGYKYDPNAQLFYLVDDETGKMYNITELYRKIEPINLLLFEVYDAHDEVEFEFMKGGIMYANLRHVRNDSEGELIALTFNEDETFGYESLKNLGTRNPYILIDGVSHNKLIFEYLYGETDFKSFNYSITTTRTEIYRQSCEVGFALTYTGPPGEYSAPSLVGETVSVVLNDGSSFDTVVISENGREIIYYDGPFHGYPLSVTFNGTQVPHRQPTNHDKVLENVTATCILDCNESLVGKEVTLIFRDSFTMTSEVVAMGDTYGVELTYPLSAAPLFFPEPVWVSIDGYLAIGVDGRET